MDLPPVEKVAALVHDAWTAGKRKTGIIHCLHQGEDLMVPYSELSDAAKDLDRATVLTVYRAIAQASEEGAG
jgi:hypothetical protein